MGYLAAFLEKLDPWLTEPDAIELAINADGAIWLERAGNRHMQRIEECRLSPSEIADLSHQIANDRQITLNDTAPILSTAVRHKDMMLRAQAVIPPASEGGAILSFRIFRPSRSDEPHRFPFLRDVTLSLEEERRAMIEGIKKLVAEGDEDQFLRAVISNKLNTIISGGTSTGKTELGRRMIWMLPENERLVTIEDSPELLPRQPNVVSLIAETSEKSPRSAARLLQATLRLRPDRIILGEVRGPEAVTFLEAINTGHGGSFTSLHAETAHKAMDRLAHMTQGAGTRLTHAEVLRYLEASIDVVIQTGSVDGQRGILEVWFPGCDSDMQDAGKE